MGFARLIEKDWGTFGHKFGERLGWEAKDRIIFEESHSSTDSAGGYGEGSNSGGGGGNFLSSVQKTFMGGGSSAYKETSPVFHQLLSTLYQLLRQFPTRFDFNELFLRRLLEESFGGKWGNFLWNSEEERKREGAKEKTRSVWELFFDLDETKGLFTLRTEFKNSLYAPEDDDATSGDMGVLLVDPTDVKWWFELYGRTDLEMNPPPLPPALRDLSSRPSAPAAIFDADELEPDMEETIRSPIPTSSLPPAPHSPSPYAAVPLTTAPTEAEQAISAALSSATKFGWGAWKSVKKGYQGAVENYRESSSASSPTTPTGNGSANVVKGRANGEELDSLRSQKSAAPTTYATYNRSSSASRTPSGATTMPPKSDSNPWTASSSSLPAPLPPPPPPKPLPLVVSPRVIPNDPLSPTTNPETTVFTQKTVQEIIGDSGVDSTSFSLEDDDEDEEVAVMTAGVEKNFDPLGVGRK